MKGGEEAGYRTEEEEISAFFAYLKRHIEGGG